MKPTGIKVHGVTADQMASKDVVMLANMAQLKTKLQPALALRHERSMSRPDAPVPASLRADHSL